MFFRTTKLHWDFFFLLRVLRIYSLRSFKLFPLRTSMSSIILSTTVSSLVRIYPEISLRLTSLLIHTRTWPSLLIPTLSSDMLVAPNFLKMAWCASMIAFKARMAYFFFRHSESFRFLSKVSKVMVQWVYLFWPRLWVYTRLSSKTLEMGAFSFLRHS